MSQPVILTVTPRVNLAILIKCDRMALTTRNVGHFLARQTIIQQFDFSWKIHLRLVSKTKRTTLTKAPGVEVSFTSKTKSEGTAALHFSYFYRPLSVFLGCLLVEKYERRRLGIHLELSLV